MTTKQKILNEALTLFAEKGYSIVYVGEIAEEQLIKVANALFMFYLQDNVATKFRKSEFVMER